MPVPVPVPGVPLGAFAVAQAACLWGAPGRAGHWAVLSPLLAPCRARMAAGLRFGTSSAVAAAADLFATQDACSQLKYCLVLLGVSEGWGLMAGVQKHREFLLTQVET